MCFPRPVLYPLYVCVSRLRTLLLPFPFLLYLSLRSHYPSELTSATLTSATMTFEPNSLTQLPTVPFKLFCGLAVVGLRLPAGVRYLTAPNRVSETGFGAGQRGSSPSTVRATQSLNRPCLRPWCHLMTRLTSLIARFFSFVYFV